MNPTSNKENRDSYVAFYGNVSLVKTNCRNCGDESIVIDGKTACCDEVCNGKPITYKRESNPANRRKLPSPTNQLKILKSQDYQCVYCGILLGSSVTKRNKPVDTEIHWEHFVPFSYSQDNRASNFYASCQICNLIKSDKFFNSLDEARRFIMNRREKKGYENYTMLVLQRGDTAEKINQEILLECMPNESQHPDRHFNESSKTLGDGRASGNLSESKSNDGEKKDSPKNVAVGKSSRKNDGLLGESQKAQVRYDADSTILNWLKKYVSENPELHPKEIARRIGIGRSALESYLKETYFLEKEKGGLGVKNGLKLENKLKGFMTRVESNSAKAETKAETVLIINSPERTFIFRNEKGEQIAVIGFAENQIKFFNYGKSLSI